MLEKWYSRYKRGDVWFLKLNTENGDNNNNSSVQKKSRPYLIVSCEENNMNSTTFNVIPICTRDNDHLPMHVFYIYKDGSANKNQIILCEQITTVSILDFDRKGSFFMYSINADLMSKVDDALAKQLGLKSNTVDIGIIEQLINELAIKKELEIKKAQEKEINVKVEQIAERIAKKFGITLTTDVINDKESNLTLADTNPLDKNKASITRKNSTHITKTAAITTSKPKQKTTKNSWTIENKRRFIQDYESLSISEMSEKWGMKKASIQQTAYKFRKELNNAS